MAFDRRKFLSASALAVSALAMGGSALGGSKAAKKQTPVVLVTDIGDDIDDTWALALLLKCPELALKLVVTDYGKPQYRAKLLAKFLKIAGHGHVPVGLGPEVDEHVEDRIAEWVKNYDLHDYKGAIHQDGVKALVDTLMASPEPVTLISIGPPPTVAAALTLEPRIAERTRFVGMYGSVRVGYSGAKTPAAEWNVLKAIKPARQVLTAPWRETIITPLDTCGLVTLEGERYRRLLASKDPIVAAVIENYRLWGRSIGADKVATEERSTVLFDTVAVYLAITQDLCAMERLNIQVTDDGFTKIADGGKPMDVASSWKNLETYDDWLVNRLLS